MKAILIALAVAVLSTSAFAQGKKGNDAPPPKPDEKQVRFKKEEEAARAASSKVPDAKEKYDPWKIGK